jgi:hypothetical protein
VRRAHTLTSRRSSLRDGSVVARARTAARLLSHIAEVAKGAQEAMKRGNAAMPEAVTARGAARPPLVPGVAVRR